MLQRLLLLLAAALFYTFQTQAQVFEPGLLVRSNGDTLRGEIENGFWVEPPTSIRFRSAEGSASRLFKPRQLRAVSFTGGRYYRYKALPIDRAAETRLDHLPRGYSPAIRTDSLLAEVLLDGPCAVYRVGTSGTVHYVLQLADQPALDLSERQYLRLEPTGMLAITNGNNYLNSLPLYFKECPTAKEMARAASFTPEALVAVAQAYNQQCTPAGLPGRSWLEQATPRRKVAFRGGVLAGVRYNRIEANSGVYTDGACADCQGHAFGGLYSELLLPNRAASVYGELSMSAFRGRGEQLVGYTSGANQAAVYTAYDFKALLGTARIGVRYYFLLPREQRLFLGFGLELNNVWNPTVTANAGAGVVRAPTEFAFAVTTLLPNLSMGWKYKRTTVFLDGQGYISGAQNGVSGAFFGSNFALRLGAGYQLGRNPDVSKAHSGSRK
jgi:hypothetical protein